MDFGEAIGGCIYIYIYSVCHLGEGGNLNSFPWIGLVKP